jgi:hypothetical protein
VIPPDIFAGLSGLTVAAAFMGRLFALNWDRHSSPAILQRSVKQSLVASCFIFHEPTTAAEV